MDNDTLDTQDMENISVLSGSTSEDVYGMDADSEEECERESIEKLVHEQGYNVEDAKLCVSGITSRIKQSCLRQENRNTAFSKTVVDSRSNRRVIICESDDYVFLCDCKQRVRSWFIKQFDGQMSDQDRDALSCLRKWGPVDPGLYKEYYDLLQRDLEAVSRAVRYFLG